MILCILLILGVIAPKSSVSQDTVFDSESQEAQSLLVLGRNQYKVLEERVSLPVYGLCWKDAVRNLEKGCKGLDENTQSQIALKFTDCFLVMSGHNPYGCEINAGSKNDCFTKMTDRAFNAYTEFYTHTQNICFYLRSQIWREETENSIHKLTKTTAHVTEQLEQAEQMQSALLEHQEKSITMQVELLDNGMTLNGILQTSQMSLHEIMSEFRISTLQQKKMIFDVFDRISSLQAWAVGEISWLDSVVFYLTSSIIAYIITATPRTQNARLWIFLTISSNLLIERSVCAYLLKDTDTEVNAFNQNLYWWIWICRKILVGICAFILVIAIYNYRDYNLANHDLLLKIQKQNLQLMEYMKAWDGTSPIPPRINEVAPIDMEKGHIFTSTPVIHDRVVESLRHLTVFKSPSPAPSNRSKASTVDRNVRKTSRKPVDDILSPVPRYNLRSRENSVSMSRDVTAIAMSQSVF